MSLISKEAIDMVYQTGVRAGQAESEALIRDLVKALDAAIRQMQQDAETIDGEWGSGRTSRQLADDGEMPEAFGLAIATMVEAFAMGYKP